MSAWELWAASPAGSSYPTIGMPWGRDALPRHVLKLKETSVVNAAAR